MYTSPHQDTQGTSEQLKYQEPQEVLDTLYRDTPPCHKDSQGISHNQNKYIKDEEGHNLICKETGHLPHQEIQGTSEQLKDQEPKEVLHSLYRDTPPSNKDSQGTPHNQKQYIKDEDGHDLICKETLDTSPHQATQGTSEQLKDQVPKEVLHTLYRDTPPCHKNSQGTSHNQKQYIKDKCSVQEHLLFHCPLGQEKLPHYGYP